VTTRGLHFVALAVALSCRFDPAYRDTAEPLTASCTNGVVECRGNALTRCDDGTPVVLQDCGAEACAPTLLRCTPCLPEALACDGADVVRCRADGSRADAVATCNTAAGEGCRNGACVNLCEDARRRKSNVACEYWAVDLDNAVLSTGDAAAQQFAVIVSNPQPDLAARVTVEEDTGAIGGPPRVRTVAEASVGVRRLEVFRLGPKEVDGAPPGAPNGGAGTALTRGAFRIRSSVPIVAWQFNPLDNVNVFSNDATILLPALDERPRFVVGGWPQTIARTDDPRTNWGLDLRAFLTVVGTTDRTRVRVRTRARIVPGGPAPGGIPRDGELTAEIGPFEVLNLETGDFNADFTGSIVEADRPVAVFVGSEASDAPFYTTLAERSCCADHLESQVVPTRAIGKTYAIARMPNRSRAIAAAGGPPSSFEEPELYRIVATTAAKTTVKTTLPPPLDTFTLEGEGAHTTLRALADFSLTADYPVLVADVQVSQEAAGISIANALPGGDPSFLFVPPIEQWRNDYVFLTPDKYAFDYVVVTAPADAAVFLDGLRIDAKVCETVPFASYRAYRCQLSFPIIDADGARTGRQNDGVHRVQADVPVGVLVYGFDYRVSYAYVGGTELVDINAN